MYFTVEKLTQRMEAMGASAVRASREVGPVYTCPAPGSPPDNAMAPPPAADEPAWRELTAGAPWGGDPTREDFAPSPMLGWRLPADGGHTHWLRATLRVPAAWQSALHAHHAALLRLDSSGEGEIEAILYVDGQAVAGLDAFHRSYRLPPDYSAGEHELLLRVYTPFPHTFGALTLQVRDERVARLAILMETLVEASTLYPDTDPAGAALLRLANEAYNRLDLRQGWQSEAYARSAHEALAALEAALERLRAHRREHDADPNEAPMIGARRPTLLSTGHGHLDVAWLWPLWRTRQKAAHTVATALHLMDRYPDYHFSMSQPQVYEFLKQDDPDLYARLHARVKEGRFEPVGLMWVEADCNVPSGESLIRQLMEGQKFFSREFGEQTHVLWLPDVFGYSAALPQLLRGCGIDVFMTTKISWNQFNRMPCDTFRWRGIDGSEVLTHFVTATDTPLNADPSEAQFYTYNGMMTPAEVIGTWRHYRQKEVSDELLYLYGYGDGGGGPTEAMLERARVMADLPGLPRVTLGRVDRYFERLYQRAFDHPLTPTWVGELYLEYHRGTYTSQSRTKQLNRSAELLYREAEWMNAWAVTLGAENQQEALNEGWRTLLLNQFHDILPGSSVPLVYRENHAQMAEVHRRGAALFEAATRHVLDHDESAGSADPPGAGASAHPILINTLPWARDEVATLPGGGVLPLAADQQGTVELDGSEVTLVAVRLPGYGYAALDRASVASTPVGGALDVDQNRLENGLLRVTLDDRGEIVSLFDLEHGREVVAPGERLNQLVTYEDRPLNWDAWDIDIFYEEKPYPLHEVASWRVAERGPVRVAIEIVRPVGNSLIRQQLRLTRGSRRLDIVTEVAWRERQTLLRALFPLNLNVTRATCEIQFGAVERPSHRNTRWDVARFEHCAHRWVDMSEGGYGVALLNDGKYGHSLRDATLGLSLLKGAIHPDPHADEGVHRFTYSLLPHGGDWREGHVTRRAYELNAPLRAVMGKQKGEGSFLHSTTDHVIVETIKVAEDGDGLILRLYESHNQRGPITLTFPRPLLRAALTDLLERELAPLEVSGRSITVDLAPFEVKTVYVRL